MYRVILPPLPGYASTQDDQIGMARYIKRRIEQGTARMIINLVAASIAESKVFVGE